MKTPAFYRVACFRWGWLALVAALLGLGGAQAAELKLEIMLIWGTNEAKSPDPKHKPVDPELAKKLQIFKWKNYFEVKKLNEVIPGRGVKKITISPKCDIEITELEGPWVEVKLFGEGKLINKTRKQLNVGEYFTLAGDVKDDAWFILIKLIEEK